MPEPVRIVDATPDHRRMVERMAELLVEGFRDFWPDAWPDLESARQEVEESFGPERISLAAVTGDGAVAGWIGGIRQYNGNVWELHPLVVDERLRGRGIARALVAALEERARAAGGLTLWLGTDDEAGLTSIGGVDVYPDVLGHLTALRNLRGHPVGLYQRLGFSVVGVMPDANGFGKPDIFLAKCLQKSAGGEGEGAPESG